MVYHLPSGPLPTDSARLRGSRSSNRVADQAVTALPSDDAALNKVPSTHCGIMESSTIGDEPMWL